MIVFLASLAVKNDLSQRTNRHRRHRQSPLILPLGLVKSILGHNSHVCRGSRIPGLESKTGHFVRSGTSRIAGWSIPYQETQRSASLVGIFIRHQGTQTNCSHREVLETGNMPLARRVHLRRTLSRSLLLERGTLFCRLFVLHHHCCSSLRRHCFSHRTLHHSVWLCDRL